MRRGAAIVRDRTTPGFGARPRFCNVAIGLSTDAFEHRRLRRTREDGARGRYIAHHDEPFPAELYFPASICVRTCLPSSITHIVFIATKMIRCDIVPVRVPVFRMEREPVAILNSTGDLDAGARTNLAFRKWVRYWSWFGREGASALVKRARRFLRNARSKFVKPGFSRLGRPLECGP